MLNDEIMGALLSNSHKTVNQRIKKDPKPDISQKEALEIYNEVIKIYEKHNVSYQCACRLTIALTEAFITGAVELYRQEQQQFPNGN